MAGVLLMVVAVAGAGPVVAGRVVGLPVAQ